MTTFPKYPKYKDSGLEWLGDVPEHWEISRSRRVFTQRKELARKDDQQLSATQAYGVIPQADYEERIGRHVVKISMHLEKRKHVEPDDFVISMRSFQGGLERAWARGAIRSSYTVLEPAIKVAPSYFAYLFKCPQYIGALQSTGNFIRDGQDLTYQNYILVDLPLPPLAEQERIGAFLDEKTAEIDRLIAKKQRQIELLDEQKAILINRAVTRGLHPHAEFQESGIPWIGPIPKHWELKRVKHCSLYFTSGSRGWGDYYADSGDAFLQSGDLTDNCTISLENVKRVRLPRRPEGLRTRLESHDTVVCITGANTGRVANVGEVQETIFVNQHLCLVRPSKSINPQYLSLALSGSAGRTHFTLSQYGLKEGLNLDDVKNCLFPLPPTDEQAEILAYIQGLSKSIETAIAKVESQIQTLQILRSTLIAHAVTGKVKV